MTTRLHALTWLVWAVAAVASVQLAPNVLYAALVLLVAALVVSVHGVDSPLARAFPLFLGLGALFALVRVVLTVLTTHGVGGVLFSLPSWTLPRLLGGFTVGGTVERQVLLQAVADSFVIVVTVGVFGAWNAVVSHHEVLESTPRAFHEPGLVVTVALAFVPSTVAALRTTQEADRARTGGVVVRRRRLLRLVVPVLERGMERAVSLAESMDSRGFAHGPATGAEQVAGWCGLGALLALAGAFVALVGRARPAAALLGAVGAGLVVAAVVVASRASRRVRYRPRRLRALDVAVMATVVVAPVAVGLLALTGNSTLVWDPARLVVPAFDLRVALALAPLAVPAAVRPVHARPHDAAREPDVVAGSVR